MASSPSTITLLVLEIGVPHLGEGESILDALGGLWPSLFGYVFGFWVIGIYWVNHHYVSSLYRRSNHFFGLLNVVFLMTIAFLPFPTAVLAEYVADPAHRDGAIVFYVFALMLPAVTWASTWFYASRVAHLVDDRLSDRFVSEGRISGENLGAVLEGGRQVGLLRHANLEPVDDDVLGLDDVCVCKH